MDTINVDNIRQLKKQFLKRRPKSWFDANCRRPRSFSPSDLVRWPADRIASIVCVNSTTLAWVLQTSSMPIGVLCKVSSTPSILQHSEYGTSLSVDKSQPIKWKKAEILALFQTTSPEIKMTNAEPKQNKRRIKWNAEIIEHVKHTVQITRTNRSPLFTAMVDECHANEIRT